MIKCFKNVSMQSHFHVGLSQHNKLLTLCTLPSFTVIKHGIQNNGTIEFNSGGSIKFIYKFSIVALF